MTEPPQDVAPLIEIAPPAEPTEAMAPPLEVESPVEPSQGAEPAAEGDSIEETLKGQQKEIDALKKRLGQFVRLGHGDETLKLSGRIHIDHWGFPTADDGIDLLEGTDPPDRFGFRRLRFGVAGDIHDNLLYKIEMEFAEGIDPQFRDAYIGIEHLPFLQTVLIGNHKRPYGLDHYNSSRYNVFLERPMIIEAFNQDSRRLGISSNGFTQDLRYNWSYGLYNMRLTQGLGNYVGDHYQLELAGRLATTPWYDETSGGRGYLHLGLAGSVGTPDGLNPVANEARYRTRAEVRSRSRWLDTGAIAGADDTLLVGSEAVLNLGPLQLCGELQLMGIDRTAGFGDRVALGGGYLYASYFLTGEHMPWDRERGVLERVEPFENFFCVRDCDGCRQRGRGAWQVAARYSYADLTDDDIVGGVGNSLTLGLNWYWNPYARWQFNYTWGDIDRDPVGGGEFNAIGTRFMVDF